MCGCSTSSVACRAVSRSNRFANERQCGLRTVSTSHSHRSGPVCSTCLSVRLTAAKRRCCHRRSPSQSKTGRRTEPSRFGVQHPQTNRDIWLLSPDRKLRPFLVTPAEETGPRISPDGRWIAFQSDENGRNEVYVQPLPGPGARRQVSTEGGTAPRWRSDGRELLPRSAESAHGHQRQCRRFDGDAGNAGDLFTMSSTNFSPSPDGQRILISKATADMGPVTLL